MIFQRVDGSLSLRQSLVLLIGIAAVWLGDAAAQPTNPPGIMLILNETLENERIGRDVPWRDAATGQSGLIRIERTHYRGHQPCRDYVRFTTGSTAAAATAVRGSACRVGRANWEIIEEQPSAPLPVAGGSADPSKGDESGSNKTKTAEATGRPASTNPPASAAQRQSPPVIFSMPTRSPF